MSPLCDFSVCCVQNRIQLTADGIVCPDLTVGSPMAPGVRFALELVSGHTHTHTHTHAQIQYCAMQIDHARKATT